MSDSIRHPETEEKYRTSGFRKMRDVVDWVDLLSLTLILLFQEKETPDAHAIVRF
jgi:hypothetical protein